MYIGVHHSETKYRSLKPPMEINFQRYQLICGKMGETEGGRGDFMSIVVHIFSAPTLIVMILYMKYSKEQCQSLWPILGGNIHRYDPLLAEMLLWRAMLIVTTYSGKTMSTYLWHNPYTASMLPVLLCFSWACFQSNVQNFSKFFLLPITTLHFCA